MQKNSWIITLLLCSFLGLFGIHRFYTGYKKIGIIQILLTISTIGTFFCFLWIIVDFILIISEKYKNKNGDTLHSENLTITTKKIIKVTAILYFLILFFTANISGGNREIENKTTQSQNKNLINKSDFTGQWAFTVDTVELRHININNELDGIEVIIDGKTYAITRNIENHEFLPDKYWENAEWETVGKYKVCNDIMLNNNTCKKSLSDIIKYAEKLPLFKTY